MIRLGVYVAITVVFVDMGIKGIMEGDYTLAAISTVMLGFLGVQIMRSKKPL